MVEGLDLPANFLMRFNPGIGSTVCKVIIIRTVFKAARPFTFGCNRRTYKMSAVSAAASLTL
jgi:hypothetical protein